MSRKGLARPLSYHHHKAHHIDLSDRLVIWPMSTAEAAEQAERNILAALGPALNHQRPHASLHVVQPALRGEGASDNEASVNRQVELARDFAPVP
jgi:hypothetical protein